MDDFMRARRILEEGGEIPRGLIRDEIRDSWMRCRGYGINAEHHHKFVLPQKEVKKRTDDRRSLCGVAFPHLDSLYDFVKGTHALISFCDEDGYIIYHRGDPDIVAEGDSVRYTLGAAQTEDATGTNGLGTPMAIKKPILILSEEHYLSVNKDWFGAGAPVFLPDSDEVCGAVCFAGLTCNLSDHTLGMVVLTAEAITRQLKMLTAYNELKAMKQNLNTMIETLPVAAVLTDREGNIKAGNVKADKLLKNTFGQTVDRSVRSLLDELPVDEAERTGEPVRRMVQAGKGGRRSQLSVTIQSTSGNDFVVQMESAASLQKRINQTIGSSADFTFDDIIGSSDSLTESIELAKIAAQNDINVFLSGESGTGKEMFAQAIHNSSPRAGGPFIAVNCGALPKSLVEAELFGYEGGSFTGATKSGSIGKFELAEGGTLFLDEIGDMPFDVQVLLLRALQNREITRVGSSKTVKIDIRVITATHQDLSALVRNDRFRADLYYRINAYNIRVPSLRERSGDIRSLADHFLKKYTQRLGRGDLEGFSQEAYAAMESYSWPGNVRQLENAVERSVYLTRGHVIMPEDLPDDVSGHGAEAREDLAAGKVHRQEQRKSEVHISGGLSIEHAEADQIKKVLAHTRGNVRQAAELLEINRRTLYRKIEKHGIDTGMFRKG